jgi:rare lipoprotein A
MYRKLFSLILLAVAVFTLSACASVPRFRSRDERYETNSAKEKIKVNESVETENFDHYINAEVLESVTGVASFYADKYHGRITYNGEVYNMNGISAAHPTYQMGTVIRVTNLSNDKSIIMRINDRMPYRPDRIIDLSLGAAKELEMVREGLAEVKVDILEWGTGKK